MKAQQAHLQCIQLIQSIKRSILKGSKLVLSKIPLRW